MKIANCILIGLSVIGAAACSTVRQMPLPEGSMGYAFQCSRMLETVDEC